MSNAAVLNRPNRARIASRLSAPVAIVAAALLVAACGQSASRPASASTQPAPQASGSVAELSAVSGQGRAGPPPWDVPSNPAERAAAAGLPIGPMGMAEHYHPQLAIVVDGDSIKVPAGIGIDPKTGQMSAVHTHTSDGVIHVEAAKRGDIFTLGQLFTEWDVKLGAHQLGSLTSAEGTLAVTVNGAKWRGNPAMLRLAPDQKITLQFASR